MTVGKKLESMKHGLSKITRRFLHRGKQIPVNLENAVNRLFR